MCKRFTFLISLTLVLGSVSNSRVQGLTGEYYHSSGEGPPTKAWRTLVLTRVDPTVDFDWSAGSPDASVNPDDFAVRWTGGVVPLYSETYRFYTRTDDGVRLWVDDELIVDNWTDHGDTTDMSLPIKLKAGRGYGLRMEWYENGGDARAHLSWESASQALEIVPDARLLPTFVQLLARNPGPPDGAENVTAPLVQWTAGETAV